MPSRLTHIDDKGRAKMVDVADKEATLREATAAGTIFMRPETLASIQSGGIAKGDVLAVARVAGIMAAKQTSTLIPLCHPLPLGSVTVSFSFQKAPSGVSIQSTARLKGRTGVEMEALTAVSVAALTIYDMCKAADQSMTIGEIRLLAKSGGRSGTYQRSEKTE